MHPSSTHLSVPLYPPFALAISPSKIKTHKQTTTKRIENISLWKVQCFHSVSHSVPPLSTRLHLQISLEMSHWSNFCETIPIGSSPGLRPVLLLLPCVMVILQLWISRVSPFMWPNCWQTIEILEWANTEPWIWAWMVASWSSHWLSCIYTTKVSSGVQ